MRRFVRTESHEYELELRGDHYVCVGAKKVERNNWEEQRIGQKVTIEDNRLSFEDGEKTTKIVEG